MALVGSAFVIKKKTITYYMLPTFLTKRHFYYFEKLIISIEMLPLREYC